MAVLNSYASGGVEDGREQGEGLAVFTPGSPQDLAVHGQSLKLPDFLFEQPARDDGFEVCRVDEAKHAVERRVAGCHIEVVFPIMVAMQGATLAVGEPLADILITLIAACSQ